MDLQIAKTLDQQKVELQPLMLEQLQRRLLGALLTPSSPGYDQARRIWNAMIDRRPAVIVQCTETEDVRQALLFARAHRLLTAVRGGGHSVAGTSVCDGGLMIDLSRMKAVTVDPARRIAHVQPGVTLSELDATTQAQALMTPLGINSTTGVAGLTLGGGFGWTSRAFGLTCDNLLSAEMVTVDGRVLRASNAENPELFWALRGGGGNFGVVTSFEFQLHPLGPQVAAGVIVHPAQNGRAVLQQYRDVVNAFPREVTSFVVSRRAPPLPFLAPEVHGQPVVIFAAIYAGAVEEGLRVMEPLRKIGAPIADVIGPMPFVQHQQLLDPLLGPGARNYWKSNNFHQVPDAVFEVMLHQAASAPSPMCELILGQLGGAIQQVPADATAYAQRDANFVLNVHSRWEDPGLDQACISWARDTFQQLAPYATGGVYVNFLSQDEGTRVQAAYGAHQQRLAVIKRQYDPENLLRLNQNIAPAPQA